MELSRRLHAGAAVGFLIGGLFGSAFLAWAEGNGLSTSVHEWMHCNNAWDSGFEGDCEISIVRPEDRDGHRGNASLVGSNATWNETVHPDGGGWEDEHPYIMSTVKGVFVLPLAVIGALAGAVVFAVIGDD